MDKSEAQGNPITAQPVGGYTAQPTVALSPTVQPVPQVYAQQPTYTSPSSSSSSSSSSVRSATTSVQPPTATASAVYYSGSAVQTAQPARRGAEGVGSDGSMGINPTTGTFYTPRPPPGRWRDNFCDCFNNCYPSCFCTACICYGMWMNAQISQKLGMWSFNAALAGFLILWFVSFIIQLAASTAIILWLPLIYALVFSIVLRLHVARVQNITEYGPCGDCMIGFFCWYCSVAQVARHVYGYTKVLDGDADPDRPDNYGPTNV